jgi:hypothetical protein
MAQRLMARPSLIPLQEEGRVCRALNEQQGYQSKHSSPPVPNLCIGVKGAELCRRLVLSEHLVEWHLQNSQT